MSAARGEAEYAELVAAYATAEPSCLNDWRFTEDESDLKPDDIGAMKRICRECRLSSLCAAYSIAAQPTAGMWSGRFHTPSKARTRKDNNE